MSIKGFPQLPLSFLLDLKPTLEELYISNYEDSEIRINAYSAEGVDLYYYFGTECTEVYKSNIWQLLPQLQFVEIHQLRYEPVDEPLTYEVFTRSRLPISSILYT